MLHPLGQLAKAWAGAVMTRDRDADDVWLQLASHVAETVRWADPLTRRQSTLLKAGAQAITLGYEFPEVFPDGFSVVLGQSALGRGAA